MRSLALLLLSSAAFAAPLARPDALPEAGRKPLGGDKFECWLVDAIVTALGEQVPATSFCSSYLHIPTDNGCTTTVKTTQTVTSTSTCTGKPVTSTITAPPTTVSSTVTSTITSTDVTITTTATVTSGTTTTNVGLITCGVPALMKRNALPTKAARDAEPVITPAATFVKRIVTSPRKPDCLKPWPREDNLSAACKCLSIKPTTKTVTSAAHKTVTTTVTKAGSTIVSTVTPTTTSTTTITSAVGGATTTSTVTTTVAASTISVAAGVATPDIFTIYTFSSLSSNSVLNAVSSAPPSGAANQLQRVIFSATMSASSYSFNNSTGLLDYATQKALVSINSTLISGGNSTNSTNCFSSNTTNSTNCTNSTSPSTGPDYGVKLDTYTAAVAGSEQPLSCSVVPVIIGKGFACKLVCSSYGSRVVNQLDANNAWILDTTSDAGDTAFQPFIAAIPH